METITEALKKLRRLDEVASESDADEPIKFVQELIFKPLGIKEVDEPEVEVKEDSANGDIWENIVHYISEEDMERLHDVPKEELIKKLPEVGDYCTGVYCYYKGPRMIPAVRFYSRLIYEGNF